MGRRRTILSHSDAGKANPCWYSANKRNCSGRKPEPENSRFGTHSRTNLRRLDQLSGLHQLCHSSCVPSLFTARATVVGTGRPYDQNYILYLRAEGRKIAVLREYFDAPRVVAAFQPQPNAG